MATSVNIRESRGVDTSTNAAAEQQGVSSASDSLQLLKKGFQRTAEHAQKLKENWDKKLESAKPVFSCNTCGKTYKTESGVKKHVNSKKTKCSKEDGYSKTAPEVKPTASDRLSPDSQDLVSKLEKAQDAARKVAASLGKSKTRNQDGFDAQRLMTYPIGNFERALREASTEALEEFVTMRFDSNTGPKKVLAQKELKRREGKSKA